MKGSVAVVVSAALMVAACDGSTERSVERTPPAPTQSSSIRTSEPTTAPTDDVNGVSASANLLDSGIVAAQCQRGEPTVTLLDEHTGQELASRTWPIGVAEELGSAAIPTACVRGFYQTLDPDLRFAAASTPETAPEVHVGWLDEQGAFTDATALSQPESGFSAGLVRDADPKFDPIYGLFAWHRVNEQRITGREVTFYGMYPGKTEPVPMEGGFQTARYWHWHMGGLKLPGAVHLDETDRYATGQCPESLVVANDCGEGNIWIGLDDEAPTSHHVPDVGPLVSVVGWLDQNALVLKSEPSSSYVVATLGADGSVASEPLLPPNERANKSMVISPDKQRVAFISTDGAGNVELYTASIQQPTAEPVLVAALEDADISLLRWQ